MKLGYKTPSLTPISSLIKKERTATLFSKHRPREEVQTRNSLNRQAHNKSSCVKTKCSAEFLKAQKQLAMCIFCVELLTIYLYNFGAQFSAHQNLRLTYASFQPALSPEKSFLLFLPAYCTIRLAGYINKRTINSTSVDFNINPYYNYSPRFTVSCNANNYSLLLLAVRRI